MEIGLDRVRRLMRSQDGKLMTVPHGTVKAAIAEKAQSAQHQAIAHAITKSNTNEASSADPSMVTAGSAEVSSLGPRNIYAPILEGFMATRDTQGQQETGGIKPDVNLLNVYRDIYMSDPICGSAVDLMSNMPFSDFTLAGAKDAKYLTKYEESIDAMRLNAFLPVLSTEYLVEGRKCCTTVFDEGEGKYTGLIPQDNNYVTITPVPLFGIDPLITLDIGNAIKALNSSKDPRAAEYLKQLPENFRSNSKDYAPDPKDVIYIARSNMTRDNMGTSIYRRLLTTWAMEKAMFRGTLDQAFKRQRAVAHMTVGDEEWQATPDEMRQLAQMLMAADMDPVGAVMVTRNGVNVNEIRNGGDFWKSSDLEDFFTTRKLRALGISESFLSGESTFNSLEQVLSVYVENMRSYRDKITGEIFYDRLFPRIAEANNYTQKSHGLAMQLASQDEDQLSLFRDEGLATSGTSVMPYMETASDGSSRRMLLRNSKMLIPQVYWHKRLRPEADSAYLEVLSTLSDKGIPIPIRLWASAGGLDMKSLLNQKDEDMRTRENVKDWTKAIMKSMPGGDQMGMGGDPGGGEDGGEFASLVTAKTLTRPGMLQRGSEEAMEKYSARNVDAGGKRHLLSKRGQKRAEEQANKKIAEAAASLGQKINRIEAKLEQIFMERNSTTKFYT